MILASIVGKVPLEFTKDPSVVRRALLLGLPLLIFWAMTHASFYFLGQEITFLFLFWMCCGFVIFTYGHREFYKWMITFIIVMCILLYFVQLSMIFH